MMTGVDGTKFEVFDEEFKSCFIDHVRVEKLWSGGRWLEGPAWFAAGRYLLFSDIPNNRVMRWDDSDGNVSQFRYPSFNTNGNSVDMNGRLLSCEHLKRRVTRTEYDGSITIIADHFQGKKLNSPNDVVAHPFDGSIWFTDPDYGILSDYEGDRASSELDGCHVYRVDPQTHCIEQMTFDFVKPNGLAFSLDGKFLYIVDSGFSHHKDGPRHIRKFSLIENRKLTGGEVFAQCKNGIFDGIRFDRQGHLWTSAKDGVYCYNKDGKLLGMIHIPEIVSNVTFGGTKRNRLFICATTSLYAVYLTVNGSGFG